MRTLKTSGVHLLACCLAVLLLPIPGLAQQNSARDGQHDFASELGIPNRDELEHSRPVGGKRTKQSYP
jgi:hypothetical protein